MRFPVSTNLIFLRRISNAFVGQGKNRNFHSTTQSQSSNFIVSSSLPPISAVDVFTIPEMVWSNLHLKENKVAFECSQTGQKLKYGDIFKQSRSFAAALIQAGLKRNDVVSVVAPNIFEFPAILFGVLDAGGILSPASPSYTTAEITRQVQISNAKFAVTIPALLPAIRATAKECPNLKSIIVVGEAQEGCHTYSEMVKVDPCGYTFLKGSQINTRESVAFLPFSSGTTGTPKGVQLTHYNVCANVKQYATPGCGNIHNIDLGEEQDRLIGVLPFFHTYGLVVSLVSHFYTGSHTLCIQKFGADTFLNNLRQIKAHVLTLVPPIISFLIHHSDITAKDFEQVRCVQSGAAPLGASLITKLAEKAGKEIFVQNMYGLTETSPAVLILDPKLGNTKIGSCGSAIPNTFLKVIDTDTGKSLGPNQRGELFIKGPQVMKGYFQNDEATRQAIDSEGWLHSGDVAYYDEDECFFVVDRIKELIKVSSLQVAPAELEDLLRLHPQVADVAVIGIPDEKHGEVPRAYIVKKAEDLSQEGVQEFLSGKISKHKELRGGIEFVKIIPKSPSGKILRRELKTHFLQKTGQS